MIKRACSYQLSAISLMIFLALCAMLYAPCPIYAEPISSTELINNAKAYDGKTVEFEGEVIGDVMKRGEFAWVNINDGKNALGIWAPASWAKEIEFTGAYKAKGDRVLVSGMFHRACPEHGGDLDIHGESLQKISSGFRVEEEIDSRKINAAIIISGLLGLLWIFRRSKKK